MEPELVQLLAELRSHGVVFDAAKPDRLERLRNLEPDSAQLLSVLVRSNRAKALLELGTSNGYSTLWLADAVRATGGHVTTTDIDRDRSSQAKANLRRAGLDAWVDVLLRDAGELLRESAADSWDMVFLDAERPAYASYWTDLTRVLRPGGMLVIDNVISHPQEVRELRQLISSTDGLTQAVVPIGAGLLLVVLDPDR